MTRGSDRVQGSGSPPPELPPWQLAAVLWGTFRVDGDAGADNEAPVRVPGTVRLVIELEVLLGGAVAVTWAGETVFGVVLGLLVVAHYATTMDRVTWLVSQ